eukprot:279168_1
MRLLILFVVISILYDVMDACCCIKHNECWKFSCCGCYNDPNDEQDCSYTCGETVESCKRYKDVCIAGIENGAIWKRAYCDKNKMRDECSNGWYEINTSQELRDGLFGPGDLSPSNTCSGEGTCLGENAKTNVDVKVEIVNE